MFRTPQRPPSGAYNCINSLWFYLWSVVVAAMLVVVWPVMEAWRRPKHVERHKTSSNKLVKLLHLVG